MIAINVRNVNEGLALALSRLLDTGTVRDSRNGSVLAFPQPVATTYSRPTERVLFSPVRNANPTFHLLESLWMLAGRNDVKFPSTLVKNMKNFTDDGRTYWGAYGFRWREFFGWDQIEATIDELKNNPQSRRVVVSMWNAQNIAVGMNHPNTSDFGVGQSGGKDVPCNTHIYFDRRDGNLNMTVCCRSNDLIWGCYGANAVHMSFLQEYVAAAIGAPVGWYTQMSNDLHLYTDVVPVNKAREMMFNTAKFNLYSGGIRPSPIVGEGETIADFDDDLVQFFDLFDTKGINGVEEGQFTTEFFSGTVLPMTRAWLRRKTPGFAIRMAATVKSLDWSVAMDSWLQHNFKNQGGVK